MFSQSVFETKKNKNKYEFQEADVIFVADLFADEYAGGAELTTEALFGTSPYKTYKLKSSDLTEQQIEKFSKYLRPGPPNSRDRFKVGPGKRPQGARGETRPRRGERLRDNRNSGQKQDSLIKKSIN